MSLFSKRIYLINISLLALSLLFYSCKEEVKNTVDFVYNVETVPTINTDSVTMQVSDSGMIRYNIRAKSWEIFDQVKDPYWLFKKGFNLEQFDTTFNVVVFIKADTAWNFTRRKLWQLRGNVLIRNQIGETFTSKELFWDQQQRKIYSHTPVVVDRPGKGLLPARRGFEMNQEMTSYTFYGATKGKVYHNEEENNNN